MFYVLLVLIATHYVTPSPPIPLGMLSFISYSGSYCIVLFINQTREYKIIVLYEYTRTFGLHKICESGTKPKYGSCSELWQATADMSFYLMF